MEFWLQLSPFWSGVLCFFYCFCSQNSLVLLHWINCSISNVLKSLIWIFCQVASVLMVWFNCALNNFLSVLYLLWWACICLSYVLHLSYICLTFVVHCSCLLFVLHLPYTYSVWLAEILSEQLCWQINCQTDPGLKSSQEDDSDEKYWSWHSAVQGNPSSEMIICQFWWNQPGKCTGL